jgi:phosphate starvation-inducible PhoH-like protein
MHPAGEVLTALYERLEAGVRLSRGDIERGPHGASEGTGTPGRGSDGSGTSVIVWRSKPARRWLSRAPAQKAYVKSLFKNELAFGIGPAGTGRNLACRGRCESVYRRAWTRLACRVQPSGGG